MYRVFADHTNKCELLSMPAHAIVSSSVWLSTSVYLHARIAVDADNTGN